ncbi:MAG: hypothetical protein AAF799_00500 [Myxococcota bacterium]
MFTLQSPLTPLFPSLLGVLGLLAAGCTDDVGDDSTTAAQDGGTTPSSVDDSASETAAAETEQEPSPSGYALGSVVISDAGRTTYVSFFDDLQGHKDNGSGIEVPGNAEFFAQGRSIYIGLNEEPTWVKYDVDEQGRFTESGRMSFASFGLGAIDYGNAFVDETTAVSISSTALLAIVWDPQTMTITGTVELPHLARDGFLLENWTTNVGPDGRVYIPARWGNWETPAIHPQVMTTIFDPHALEIVGVAEDDRCASGGRIVFDADGYGYVLGDGRNYSIQMIANSMGAPAPENCLLRIPPGGTDFEEGFHVTIPSLTGGLEAITELETAQQGSGVGFTKIFHPDMLPEGVEPVDFSFWDHNAHQLWRIELGDEPQAVPVVGAPFSTVGFAGAPIEGTLYVGESLDGGATSDVYAVDPVTNTMEVSFSMDGYFYGVYALD